MNDFSPEYRLKLIKALAILGKARRDETYFMMIAFLCDMPAEFLEANKQNYAEAIELAKANITMEI